VEQRADRRLGRLETVAEFHRVRPECYRARMIQAAYLLANRGTKRRTFPHRRDATRRQTLRRRSAALPRDRGMDCCDSSLAPWEEQSRLSSAAFASTVRRHR